MLLSKYLFPILNIACFLQTKYRLYLVLDFINGGHLFFQLYRQGLFR
jgi:ribosomal protein S6 kinase beta